MKRMLSRKRLASTSVLLAGAVLLAACDDDRPVTEVNPEIGGVKVLVNPTSHVLPTGTALLQGVVVNDFVASAEDAFGRITAPLAGYGTLSVGGWSAAAFNFGNWTRSQAGDTRLPLLQPSTASVVGMGLYPPNTTGAPGRWNFIADLTGLNPNTEYTVVLARLSLLQNGQLDAEQVLLGQTGSAPDVLSFAGGTPGGSPNAVCNYSGLANVSTTTNPVVMGYQTSNAAGTATFDCIPTAENNPDAGWWRNTAAAQDAAVVRDSLPFGENALVALPAGRYNYVLFYEGRGTVGAPVPAGGPILRAQIGPDIDASGNVINNAFRPFPAAPMTALQLLAAPGGTASGAFGAPASVRLTLSNLPTLNGRSYNVWLYDRATETYSAAPGDVTIDGETTSGASFNAVEGEVTTVQLDGLSFGANTHLVLSHESGAATSPSQTKFFVREYLTEARDLAGGALTFGSFNPGGADRSFALVGNGEAELFGDSLIVRIRRLNPAPQGFHYQGYLVSLDDADEVDFDAPVQRVKSMELNSIGNTVTRIGGADAGALGLAGYEAFVAVLEPDGSPGTGINTLRMQQSFSFKAFFAR